MTKPIPTPLPFLFRTEAILKVLGGVIFLLSPATILQNLQTAPHHPTSLSLIRSLGTQTLAFSIPLFLAARNDATSVRSRRIVYLAVLGREGLLAVENVDEDDKALEEGYGLVRRAKEEDEGFANRKLRRGLWLWVAELVPFIIGRVWILRSRSEWFE
ncbi:hypothetical protein B0J11DRAFT_521084 [Dendryphion nanum]|uniref:Uncharacterized protein n=1 Tax=Dendryphion nanum TaxID=256645 RepID=A0A9P9E7U3_9PLEO|nr:hypothetical protein B0J11DRAFT_521084 [Dendryphion nanum]